jgi:hypothetical protein
MWSRPARGDAVSWSGRGTASRSRSLTISLGPESRAKPGRAGLPFLLRYLFYAGQPKRPEDLATWLAQAEKTADGILRAHPPLAGLDLDTEDGANRAFEVLKQDQDSRPWFALLLAMFAAWAKDAVEETEPQAAAWAAYHAATAHAMTVVTEPVFHQTLWRGYLASQIVYEAAAAAASTPAESEATKALEPLFNRLDEATLYAWVRSGEPIGPRLGVTRISEPLLKALAEWHLVRFERQRAEETRVRENRKFLRELRVKWAVAGVGAATFVWGVVWAVLKSRGIL